jgi:hypothetical protein
MLNTSRRNDESERTLSITGAWSECTGLTRAAGCPCDGEGSCRKDIERYPLNRIAGIAKVY